MPDCGKHDHGKTPEEIQKTFNIKSEFTLEAGEEVRRENQWTFNRKSRKRCSRSSVAVYLPNLSSWQVMVAGEGIQVLAFIGQIL